MKYKNITAFILAMIIALALPFSQAGAADIEADTDPVTVTVDFNANGASGQPPQSITAAISENETSAEVLLPDGNGMFYEGRKFGGWSESPEGSPIDGVFNTAADATLYAVWPEDGGSGLSGDNTDVNGNDTQGEQSPDAAIEQGDALSGIDTAPGLTAPIGIAPMSVGITVASVELMLDNEPWIDSSKEFVLQKVGEDPIELTFENTYICYVPNIPEGVWNIKERLSDSGTYDTKQTLVVRADGLGGNKTVLNFYTVEYNGDVLSVTYAYGDVEADIDSGDIVYGGGTLQFVADDSNFTNHEFIYYTWTGIDDLSLTAKAVAVPNLNRPIDAKCEVKALPNPNLVDPLVNLEFFYDSGCKKPVINVSPAIKSVDDNPDGVNLGNTNEYNVHVDPDAKDIYMLADPVDPAVTMSIDGKEIANGSPHKLAIAYDKQYRLEMKKSGQNIRVYWITFVKQPKEYSMSVSETKVRDYGTVVYGDYDSGTDGLKQSYTITNTGTETLTNITIAFSQTGSAFDSPQPSNVDSLAPGDKREFEINVSDDSLPLGTYTGELTVSAAGVAAQKFGTVLRVVNEHMSALELETDGDIIDFGTLKEGYSNDDVVPKAFVVTNKGTQEVTITAELDEAAPESFEIIARNAGGKTRSGGQVQYLIAPKAGLESPNDVMTEYTATLYIRIAGSDALALRSESEICITRDIVFRVAKQASHKLSFSPGTALDATGIPDPVYLLEDDLYTIPNVTPTVGGNTTFVSWKAYTSTSTAIRQTTCMPGDVFKMIDRDVEFVAQWRSVPQRIDIGGSGQGAVLGTNQSNDDKYIGNDEGRYGVGGDKPIVEIRVNPLTGRFDLTPQQVEELFNGKYGFAPKASDDRAHFTISFEELERKTAEAEEKDKENDEENDEESVDSGDSGKKGISVYIGRSGSNAGIPNSAFDFSLSINGENITDFDNPITLSINTEGLDISNLANLSGARYNEDGSYDYLGGWLNGSNFYFNTLKLSTYCLVEAPFMTRLHMRLDNTVYEHNGKTSVLDVPPTLIDGCIMAPLRPIIESFGATVSWNDEKKTATVSLRGEDSDIIIGEASPGMETAPVIVDGRTLVPLKYIGEQFRSNVVWTDETGDLEVYR